MNNRAKVEMLRKKYPAGTVLELVSMDDAQAPEPGTKGKVIYVDDIGTIHVQWDNGSSLGLIYGEDSFKIIS